MKNITNHLPSFSLSLSLNIWINLWSNPPRIFSTIVQLLNLGMVTSISVSMRPRSGQKSLLMGRRRTAQGMPEMLRCTWMSSFSFSLLMFSMMRPVRGQTQLQEQRVGESWLILPLRCARSMHACSTISSQLPFSRSMPTWWLPQTSRVSSKFCVSFHSGMMMRQYSPTDSEDCMVILFPLPYLPSIHRYPLNSLCTSITLTHIYSYSNELFTKNLLSFCCSDTMQSLFCPNTSLRMEYSARSWWVALYLPMVLVERVGQTFGEQRKALLIREKAQRVRGCQVKRGPSAQTISMFQLRYLMRSTACRLSSENYPMAKESTDSRAACRLVSSFYDLFLKLNSRGDNPMISLRKSIVLPNRSSSQAEQQCAKAFSSRCGHTSTPSPLSACTLAKAGPSPSPSASSLTGTYSSRMMDFQLLCWKILTRQSPYWLKVWSSNMRSRMQVECLTALRATARNSPAGDWAARVILA